MEFVFEEKIIDDWVLKLKNDMIFTKGATYTVYLLPNKPPSEDIVKKIIVNFKKSTGKDIFWHKSTKMFYYEPLGV